MSEDDGNTGKPKRGPLLQRICEIMQKTGYDYAKAYDLVMNPQPEQESNVTDEVRETIREMRQSIKENKQAVKTNKAVRDFNFTIQGYLLDKLKQDVEKIEAEKENVEVVKAGWLRKKAKTAETARKIMKFAKEMDSWKDELQEIENSQNERSKQIKKAEEAIIKWEKTLNEGLENAVKETKGYVKKISQSQLREFEEN
jgi:hypothetical protein